MLLVRLAAKRNRKPTGEGSGVNPCDFFGVLRGSWRFGNPCFDAAAATNSSKTEHRLSNRPELVKLPRVRVSPSILFPPFGMWTSA
jgi:hypothetical protein